MGQRGAMAPSLLSCFSIVPVSWFTFAIVSICCGPLTCLVLATPLAWPIATMLLVVGHLAASGILQDQKQCPTFYLLNVEPYPVSDNSAAVWDKTFELIPAGHLATEQINNLSDIFLFILWNSITPISSVKIIKYIPGGSTGLPYLLPCNHSQCYISIVVTSYTTSYTRECYYSWLLC